VLILLCRLYSQCFCKWSLLPINEANIDTRHVRLLRLMASWKGFLEAKSDPGQEALDQVSCRGRAESSCSVRNSGTYPVLSQSLLGRSSVC